MEPVYVGREQLASATDVRASAYLSATLDRKCASGSRAAEAFLNVRHFYPLVKTRYFDWPNTQDVGPWRIYFDDEPLISLTSFTSGGVTIPAASFNLEPNASGPPYDYLELIRSTSYSFASGTTPQRALAVTGVWGETASDDATSTLSAAMTDTTGTSITVTTPAGDVGSILRIDSERLLLAEKSWSSSGMTVGNASGLLASAADQLVTVSSTTTYSRGEILLADAERMLVQDVISSTVLSVRRAYDGTTLATHANGTTIYRQLSLTVTRGALGTTAATHLNAAPVYRWRCPSLVEELSLAYALDARIGASTGYARPAGSGDSTRPLTGVGIQAIEARAFLAHGRTARMRTV